MRDSPRFDPIGAAMDFGLGLCALCYIQVSTLLQRNQGSRAFPTGLKIFTFILVWLAVAFWGGVALGFYGFLYSLVSTGHRIHHLTRKEDDLPHSKYDGEPWLLDNLIPNWQFSKKEWWVWWPDDMEVMLKWIIQPALFVLIGYALCDAGETKLGLYLILIGMGAFVFMSYRHSKDMDQYYEEVDERNRQRYLQQKQQGHNPKNYGFENKLVSFKPERVKIPSLNEEELKARIQAIDPKARPQPQAPPMNDGDSNDQDSVVVFEESSAASPTTPSSPIAHSSSNGIPRTATLTRPSAKSPKNKNIQGDNRHE